MSRIRTGAISANGSNRRLDIIEPPNVIPSGRPWRGSPLARESARWRRAWKQAWHGPARTRADLIARARLAVADPSVMGEDEGVRLARDVLAVLGREGWI